MDGSRLPELMEVSLQVFDRDQPLALSRRRVLEAGGRSILAVEDAVVAFDEAYERRFTALCNPPRVPDSPWR